MVYVLPKSVLEPLLPCCHPDASMLSERTAMRPCGVLNAAFLA